MVSIDTMSDLLLDGITDTRTAQRWGGESLSFLFYPSDNTAYPKKQPRNYPAGVTLTRIQNLI